MSGLIILKLFKDKWDFREKQVSFRACYEICSLNQAKLFCSIMRQKNAGMAKLRRGFLTKLAGKRMSINGVDTSYQALSGKARFLFHSYKIKK